MFQKKFEVKKVLSWKDKMEMVVAFFQLNSFLFSWYLGDGTGSEATRHCV